MSEITTINPIEHITRIAFGIRHQRLFKIGDVSGQIVDMILRDSKTPFPKNLFVNLLESQSREKILVSNDKMSRLTINTDDLIFEYGFDKSNFEDSYKWVVEECFPFLFDNVITKYGIKDFLRVGIIFGHELDIPSFSNNMVTNITSSTLTATDSLVLRFSKRLPVEEALVKKGVNDYRNVICTMSQDANNKLKIDFDLQHYFDPPLEIHNDFKFPRFFNDSKTLLFSTYHPMLLRMIPTELLTLAPSK